MEVETIIRLTVEKVARTVGFVEVVAHLAYKRLKYVKTQWNKDVFLLPFYSNKSQGIVLP